MPLSLREMCYLRITGNVNPEKFPGKCEKYDQQYLWSNCRLSYHTCKHLCKWYYILQVRDMTGSLMTSRLSVCVGGIIFHRGMAEGAGSCLEPVVL